MKLLRRLAAILVVGTVVAAGLPQTPVKAFQPVAWNEAAVANVNGSTTATFHEKFANYVDDANNWQPIDLTPVKDATGFHYTKGPYQVDAPLKANGQIKFTSTNRYSVSERKIRDDAPVSSLKTFTDAVAVNGQATPDGILYQNAFPSIGADLLLQPNEMEFRYLIVWHSLPPQCVDPTATFQIPFTQQFDGGLVPRKRNQVRVRNTPESLSGGTAVAVNSFRGIGTPVAHIWDSGKKRDTIDVIGKFTAPVLSAAKVINCSFYRGATYPVKTDTTSTFFPDPNTEVTSVDGRSQKDNSGVWSTTHDAATGSASSDSETTSFTTTYYDGIGTYQVTRTFLLFDTSSLTSAANISSATLQQFVTAKSDQDNDGKDYIAIMLTTPGSNTAITTSDYSQFTTVEQSDEQDITGITTGGYVTWTLNATGLGDISKTSVSKFGAREGHDILNTAPGSGHENSITFRTADFTGTSSDPILTVTSTTSSPAAPQPININVSNLMKYVLPKAYADDWYTLQK